MFFLLWPEGHVLTPQLPLGVTDKDSAAVRLGVVLPLIFYAVLLPSVLLWMWFFPVSFAGAGFHPGGEIGSVLRGGFVGLSWAGIWLWLWLVLSAPQRLRREVPGLGASFKWQVVVWLAGAVIEELWRVVGITTLVTSGYSSTFSVVLCSLVFAVGFLDGGLERSALAGLEGGLFGILFLWHRVVPGSLRCAPRGSSSLLMGNRAVFQRRAAVWKIRQAPDSMPRLRRSFKPPTSGDAGCF